MEIRILLIDDQEIFRVGVRSILTDTEIRVVGQASTPGEAMELAERTRPDIAILEVQSVHFDGLEFLRQFRLAFPQVRVMILTHRDSAQLMPRAAVLGVRDFLFKDILCESLANAIKNVYYNTNISENDAWMRVIGQRDATPRDEYRPLTAREEQILRLVVAGQSNKEIARTLSLSPDTVKEHLQHIFRKISVSDRTQAAVWAIRRGMA